MPEENSSSFRPRHLLFIWAFSCFFIPFLSLIGRRLQYWVYGHIGEALIGWLIGLILLGLGGAAFYWLVKWHLRDRRNILILISILLAVLFIAINFQLPQPEERLHFVTFGIFRDLQ